MAQADWLTPDGYTIVTDADRPVGEQQVIELTTGQRCYAAGTGPAAWTSNTIVAMVKLISGKVGFIGFGPDKNNCYVGSYNLSDLYWYIDKYSGGVLTSLGYLYDTSISANVWYKLKFTIAAKILTISIWDDTNKYWIPKVSAQDETFTSGTAGLYVVSGTGRFDDFRCVKGD